MDCSILFAPSDYVEEMCIRDRTVFFAKPVRSAADEVIAPLIGMVVLVVLKADRIENQVVMNLSLIHI